MKRNEKEWKGLIPLKGTKSTKDGHSVTITTVAIVQSSKEDSSELYVLLHNDCNDSILSNNYFNTLVSVSGRVTSLDLGEFTRILAFYESYL